MTPSKWEQKVHLILPSKNLIFELDMIEFLTGSTDQPLEMKSEQKYSRDTGLNFLKLILKLQQLRNFWSDFIFVSRLKNGSLKPTILVMTRCTRSRKQSVVPILKAFSELRR